ECRVAAGRRNDDPLQTHRAIIVRAPVTIVLKFEAEKILIGACYSKTDLCDLQTLRIVLGRLPMAVTELHVCNRAGRVVFKAIGVRNETIVRILLALDLRQFAVGVESVPDDTAARIDFLDQSAGQIVRIVKCIWSLRSRQLLRGSSLFTREQPP